MTAPTPERRVGEARWIEAERIQMIAALDLADSVLGLSQELWQTRSAHNERVLMAREILAFRAENKARRSGGEWLTMGNDYAEWPDRDAVGVEWEDFAASWNEEALAQRAANARLAAEVERLTKEKAEALALADEALALGRVSDDQWCTKEGDRYDRVATRLAALSLPTPAPEATNGTG